MNRSLHFTKRQLDELGKHILNWSMNEWKNEQTRRIILFVIIFVLYFTVTSLGVLRKMDPNEAQNIVQELNNTQIIMKMPSIGISLIFGYYFMQSLLMVIPGLGPFVGAFQFYNTGVTLADYSTVTHTDPLFIWSTSFLFSFKWIEHISYSLAISESLWLIHAVLKRRFTNELPNTYKTIAICAVLLLLTAYLETYLLSLL